jgi:hypothetical protein
MKNTLMLGLAAAALFALPAGAQPYYPRYPYTTVYGRGVPYSPWAPGARGPSAQQWTQYEYNQSGTLGRLGLGASPYHPEGPGNPVSPR